MANNNNNNVPQHHLIIFVPQPPLSGGGGAAGGDTGSEEEEESGILLAHGVTVADIEPAVLALARMQGADGLRRAARLAATNRALRQHGFRELLRAAASEEEAAEDVLLMGDTMRLLSHAESEELRPLCVDEVAGIAAAGLTEEEYRAIKGVDGIVMGLHLDAKARQRLRAICKQQEAEGPVVTLEKIRRYARLRLKQRLAAAAPDAPAAPAKRKRASGLKRKRQHPSEAISVADRCHI